jgi:hypothetical protein
MLTGLSGRSLCRSINVKRWCAGFGELELSTATIPLKMWEVIGVH